MPAYGLSEELHSEIAQQLYNAEKSVVPTTLLSSEYPVFTQADAYAIQRKGLKLRLADGHTVIGRKIGITSKAMMAQLQCNSPDFGYLLDHTEIPEGCVCIRSELNAPMVEGEIAFVMGKDLNEGPITEQDIIEATDHVAACFEVCDTRYPDWNVTVRDTICDNGGASRFMVGEESKPLNEIDPVNIGMVLEKNGEALGSATGSEVMGSPINSVTWLANKLLEYGDYLKVGDIVLSGSFMGADFAEYGDVYTMKLDGFAPLTLRFG